MSFTVFLGNLPVWVTKDDIKSWLNAENLVYDDVKVIRNPETQESKGFAFIDTPNSEEMNSIIRRFDRAPLEDRLLRANQAQPPRSKGPGPRGPAGQVNRTTAGPPRRERGGKKHKRPRSRLVRKARPARSPKNSPKLSKALASRNLARALPSSFLLLPVTPSPRSHIVPIFSAILNGTCVTQGCRFDPQSARAGGGFVSNLLIIRFLFVVLLSAAAWFLHPFDFPAPYSAAAGILAGAAIVLFEIQVRKTTFKRLFGAAFGSLLGILARTSSRSFWATPSRPVPRRFLFSRFCCCCGWATSA